jgi:hypothetical protein
VNKVPEEIREKRRLTTLWTAARPKGKMLQLLGSDDGRILLSAKEGDSRVFFQLDDGELATLAIKILGVLMRK